MGDSGNESSREWNLKLADNTVRGRCSALYGKELLSDVCFVVGQQGTERVRIPAHKFILSMSSPVFYAMFHGPLAEKGEIRITDIEPEAFNAMLKYLYTDELDVDCKHIASLAYCAKKYLLAGLSEDCLRYLKTKVTNENVLAILDQCVVVKEDDMASECLKVIDYMAFSVLNSDSFHEINIETLKRIISRPTFNAPEIEIFMAVLKWAKAECGRRRLEESGENCRGCLGEALFQIRFPIMSMNLFACVPVMSGLLRDREMLDIFLYHTADLKPELPFPVTSRLACEWKKCTRLVDLFRKHDSSYLKFTQDAIQFSVNRRILLTGVEVLIRPLHNCVSFTLKCELKSSQKVLQITSQVYDFLDSKPGPFELTFFEPVIIEANTFYTISVCFDPPQQLYCTTSGRHSLTVDSVTFHFKRVPRNHEHGLISAILFHALL